jgi:hypothetical protein
MREGFESSRGGIFGRGEVREDLPGLSESDAGAVSEDFGDGAVLGRKRRGVEFEDFGVGVGVEVGRCGEEFWRSSLAEYFALVTSE